MCWRTCGRTLTATPPRRCGSSSGAAQTRGARRSTTSGTTATPPLEARSACRTGTTTRRGWTGSPHRDCRRVTPLLDRLRALVANVPPGGSVTLPRDWLAGELEALPSSNGNGEAPAPVTTERLLTAREAAPLLGVTPRWLYRRAKSLPFARRLGP